MNTDAHTAKKNTLTIGLEKWSSARPRSMVRSGLLFLFPENSSGLASEKKNKGAVLHEALSFHSSEDTCHSLVSALRHTC